MVIRLLLRCLRPSPEGKARWGEDGATCGMAAPAHARKDARNNTAARCDAGQINFRAFDPMENRTPLAVGATETSSLRDALICASLPASITVFTFNGQAISQNPGSIRYFGRQECGGESKTDRVPPLDFLDPNSASLAPREATAAGVAAPSSNLLERVFEFEPDKLERLLQEVVREGGGCWRGVVRVPATLTPHSSWTTNGTTPTTPNSPDNLEAPWSPLPNTSNSYAGATAPPRLPASAPGPACGPTPHTVRRPSNPSHSSTTGYPNYPDACEEFGDVQKVEEDAAAGEQHADAGEVEVVEAGGTSTATPMRRQCSSARCRGRGSISFSAALSSVFGASVAEAAAAIVSSSGVAGNGRMGTSATLPVAANSAIGTCALGRPHGNWEGGGTGAGLQLSAAAAAGESPFQCSSAMVLDDSCAPLPVFESVGRSAATNTTVGFSGEANSLSGANTWGMMRMAYTSRTSRNGTDSSRFLPKTTSCVSNLAPRVSHDTSPLSAFMCRHVSSVAGVAEAILEQSEGITAEVNTNVTDTTTGTAEAEDVYDDMSFVATPRGVRSHSRRPSSAFGFVPGAANPLATSTFGLVLNRTYDAPSGALLPAAATPAAALASFRTRSEDSVGVGGDASPGGGAGTYVRGGAASRSSEVVATAHAEQQQQPVSQVVQICPQRQSSTQPFGGAGQNASSGRVPRTLSNNSRQSPTPASNSRPIGLQQQQQQAAAPQQTTTSSSRGNSIAGAQSRVLTFASTLRNAPAAAQLLAAVGGSSSRQASFQGYATREGGGSPQFTSPSRAFLHMTCPAPVVPSPRSMSMDQSASAAATTAARVRFLLGARPSNQTSTTWSTVVNGTADCTTDRMTDCTVHDMTTSPCAEAAKLRTVRVCGSAVPVDAAATEEERNRAYGTRVNPHSSEADASTVAVAETEDLLVVDDCDEQECWHEVWATRATDPVSGRNTIVIVQHDVTAKVVAERHLAMVMEAEHRLLEQLFPKHILTHFTEEWTHEAEQVAAAVAAATRGGAEAALEDRQRKLMAASKNNLRWRPVVRDCNALATWHPEVTLLFADIKGFTPCCKEVSPREVMTMLNDLFSRFDSMLDQFGVFKVETIGDCYFVAGGLIQEDEDGMCAVRDGSSKADPLHAQRVFMFAKAMLSAAKEVRMPTTGEPVEIRIGISSGPVVSGVVGTRMPRFCLFGDSVNTTSRMESTGQPGAIHASDSAYQLLRSEAWQPTGGIEVKGKGLMETYMWRPYQAGRDDGDDADAAADNKRTYPCTPSTATATAAAAAVAAAAFGKMDASGGTTSGPLGGPSSACGKDRRLAPIPMAALVVGGDGNGGSNDSACGLDSGVTAVDGMAREGRWQQQGRSSAATVAAESQASATLRLVSLLLNGPMDRN